MVWFTHALRACPHHAEVERMRRRKRAPGPESSRHRDAGHARKIAHLAHRPETMMPCPARITGRFELWINSSACAYSAEAGDRSGR